MMQLPIATFRRGIVEAVCDHSVVVITAETGAGKSTQVPQYLLEEGWDLVVTQPRRLAARTVAQRVAEERGEALGETVGYRTAVDRQDSPATRCLFCTDGLALVRELMGQNRADILVLDEVHEWNENMEVLVAWAKRQIEEGVDFKVVLMSATMEAEKLARFFGNDTPVISVPGRQFPVEDRRPSSRLVDDVAALVREGRNVLVFQPGKQEIGETIRALEAMEVNAEILPLHGELTPEEQARCFKHYGRPKVVVSTNVAQTSVTIDDIDAVVDSGMERRIELVDGVEGLYLKPISLADATQRKGRAGRTKEGIYIDHCGASSRPDFPVAEILRKRLDQTVLRLAIAGFDMEELEFFHQPSKSAIRDAKRALVALGCMTADGQVTKVGRLVNRLPVSVQYGRMLVEADRLGVVDDVLTVAAILEQGGITVPSPSCNQPDRPDWRQMVPDESESDVMGQLSVWKLAENMTKDEMRERGISIRSYFRAKEIRRHLAQAVRQFFRFGSTGRREDILKAVCAGMVDHLYHNNGYGRYTNGEGVERELGSASCVRSAEWLVGKPFDLQIKTRRGMMILKLIELASKVDPMWLAEVAPQLVEKKTGLDPRYSSEKDVVVSTTQVFFNGQMVREEEVADGEHPEAATVFARWLSGRSELPGSLTETDAGRNLDAVLRANAERQERARQMNIRSGEETFKVYSQDEMFERFVTALSGARRVAEVMRPEVLALPALDKELVVSVLRDNPDVISLLGSELAVEYADHYGYTRTNPRVKLSEELVSSNRWLELPDEGVRLPGGRLVEVAVSFGYYATISDTDIPRLKEKVREHLNQEQWDGWSDRPEIAIPDPAVESSEIPLVTAVYGQCVVTGEELKAYGTVRYRSSYYSSGWEAVWFRDCDEAEKVRAEAAQKLEALREEARQKRELEAERAEAEAAREELKALQSHEDWYELDYELRREVEYRRYSYLPNSTEELRQYTADTKALVAKVEAAFAELERRREAEARAEAEQQARRQQGAKRLLSLLSEHLSNCPFCGQSLEWSEEGCKHAIEYGCLNLPCGCYPEETLESTIAGIEAGIAGESLHYDKRYATVLKRLVVGGTPAIQFILYYKYGCWNLAGVLDVDAAIADDGDAEWVEVWREPTETEIRIAQLRRQAETYEADRAAAEADVAAGYAHRLSFRRGKHPKTGEEQWEANRRGVKFVLDRRSKPVEEGREYFCRETRTLVDTPKFKLIAVEAYLPITSAAQLEAEIAGLERNLKNETIEKVESEPPESEENADLSKVDLSKLFCGRA